MSRVDDEFEAKRGTLSLSDFIPRIRRVVTTEQFLLFNQELLALVIRCANCWRLFRNSARGSTRQPVLLFLWTR